MYGGRAALNVVSHERTMGVRPFRWTTYINLKTRGVHEVTRLRVQVLHRQCKNDVRNGSRLIRGLRSEKL